MNDYKAFALLGPNANLQEMIAIKFREAEKYISSLHIRLCKQFALPPTTHSNGKPKYIDYFVCFLYIIYPPLFAGN